MKATVTYCGVPQMVGQTYGRLTVLERIPSKRRGSWWRCVCACGSIKDLPADALRSGNTRSCGCLHRDSSSQRIKEMSHRHGMARTKTYRVWASMRARCRDEKSPGYANYGGRGISVCPRWDESFESFLADMGECPRGMSIDRIDNDGNYEPSNCRWATREVQNNNRRPNVWLEHRGKRKTVSQWAAALGVSPSTLHGRLALGWPVAKTLDTPIRKLRKGAKA